MKANDDKEIFISHGFKISPKDDQLQADGPLSHFYNLNKIKAILNEAGFKETLISQAQSHHRFTGQFSVSIKISDKAPGAFDIYFYKTQKDSLKDIIYKSAYSSLDLNYLNQDAKNFIQKGSIFKDLWISKGLSFSVQDDRLKPNRDLHNFYNQNQLKDILNEAGFKEALMNQIKAKYKLSGNYKSFIKMGNKYSGTFEIGFYKNEEKSFKQLILENAVKLSFKIRI